MVIGSSNRSPSPISMRQNPNPNLNPNSRNNQEREGAGVRKSFNGYPFAKSSINSQPRSFVPNTPVNSPAEYARRSSFGRECGVLLRDHEQKENERDPNLKPVAKVRSPSISKGAKNFMSPTISAASKINPSPRKKVLGERNEAIRTSASLSDGKFHFFSTNSLEFADENESKSDMETPISDFNKVSKEVYYTEPEKNVADMSPGIGKIELEADLVLLGPEVPLNSAKSSEALPKSEMPKIVTDDNGVLIMESTSYSSSSMMAPLDADPSLPYDPKTNFLSPRPQFLHYKPNPRIETYISEGINLEDDFVSELVSETENSEVRSEDSQNEQEGSSSSVGTSFVEEKPPSSELSSPKSQQLEKIVEPKIEPRPRFGGTWKTLTLVLFILLGSISFSFYSPGVGNFVYHEKIISQIYNNHHVAVDLAKENFNVLFKNAKLWSAQSVGIMSQMIFREKEVEFSNITGWQEEEVEDYVVNGLEGRSLFERKDGIDKTMEKDAENEMPTNGEDVQHEIFVDETEFAEKLDLCSDLLPLMEQVIEETEPEKLEDTLLEDEDSSVVMTEEISLSDEPEILQEAVNNQEEYVQDESRGDFEVEVQLFSSSQQGPEEVYPQVTNANEPISEALLLESEEKEEVESVLLLESEEKEEVESVSESSVLEVTKKEEVESVLSLEFEEKEEVESVSESSVLEVTDGNYQNFEATERSLAPSTALSLVVVSLLLAATFVFVKKPKKDTAGASTLFVADQFVAKDKSASIPVATKIHENISSWSSPVVVDMIGESCPSEMSSFQKTSSCNKRNIRDGDEAHSVERSSKRNHKRESLASSSSEYTMCSSYGSFTTYSILHSKHRDDEVVTPVRRSSRIRSKVTSP